RGRRVVPHRRRPAPERARPRGGRRRPRRQPRARGEGGAGSAPLAPRRRPRRHAPRPRVDAPGGPRRHLGTTLRRVLPPRRGRSSYLGRRALGHPDPGAEAAALWLRALALAVAPPEDP